jgi:DNA-binding SARP family transcriptional activator/tetratricopeptide (TPR) repeat protein
MGSWIVAGLPCHRLATGQLTHADSANLYVVEFYLLGPVEARVRDQLLGLGRRRERLLLGVLLLDAGKAISIERLVDLLWTDEPAPAARASLHSHIARLRSVLTGHGVRITTLGGAYVAEVDPSTVDAHRFRRQVERARQLTDHAQRAELLAHTLDLWRGPLLADAADDELRSRIGADLLELRLAATEAWAQAELALGRPHPVIERLSGIVAEERTHEGLTGQLMLALYRDGRQADALATFTRIRDTLDRELGIDPGPDLTALHERILRNETTLSLPTPPNPPTHRRQFLPRDVPEFTGRGIELGRLDDLAQPDRSAPTILITAISGTPGVGKTALAIHWGHRMADRFPDGQLYIDLRGYDTRRPTDPIDALAVLLRALGVDPDRIPTDIDEAAALLRALLADQKVLILLDNARSASQVRPLLPASRDCLVLITSREALTGLLVHDGARRLELEVMTPTESLALLARIVGERRRTADPDALAELAAWCDHLPIALRVAGAMLVDRPHTTVHALLEELRERGRLVALDIADDPKSSLRLTFSHSLASLPGPVSEVFIRLGLTGGVQFDVDAVAALCGISGERASSSLRRLADAHLIVEPSPGWYGMHDLLREYAEEVATQTGDADDDRAAIDRLHGWYLGGCDNAAALLYPQMLRLPADPDEVRRGPRLETRAEALAWLEAQWPNLVIWFHAVRTRSPRQAWLLADALRGYFWLSCFNVEWLGVASAALELAQAAGDDAAVAAAELSLGNVHLNLNDHARAIEHYAAASNASAAADWSAGRASALNNLAMLHWLRGDLDEAEAGLHQALALNRSIGRRLGEARNLSQLGQLALDRGQLAAASSLTEQALAIEVELDSVSGQMKDTILLGVIAHQLGDVATAEARLVAALDDCRTLGEARGEFDALKALADLFLDLGRCEEAGEFATRAEAIADSVGDPHGDAEAANVLGAVDQCAGQFEAALRHYQEAVRLADLAEDDHPRIIAQTGLARVWLELGRLDDAHAAATEAIDVARRRGYRLLEADALVALARAATASGRTAAAAESACAALSISRESGHRLGIVRALLALADASHGTECAAHRAGAKSILADLGIPSGAYRS